MLADGAPGVVSRTGIVVADADGRARVLARTDRGAPAPIGVVGDRVVHWTASDTIAVTELRAGSPLDVVVRGVTEAGALGADGSLWLRSDADPVGTVRRLDVAGLDGQQRIAVTYLPVVTIQEPDPPVDLRTVLPVPGGGLRTVSGGGRLEMLTGTAAGIATTPLAGSRCGAAGTAGLDHAVADGSGVWFVLAGADGDRLAHLDPNAGSAVRTVPAVLPGAVTAPDGARRRLAALRGPGRAGRDAVAAARRRRGAGHGRCRAGDLPAGTLTRRRGDRSASSRAQPQAARRGSPDVLTRRAVANRTTTAATAAATPTAAGGAFSAMPTSAQTAATAYPTTAVA